MTDGPYYTTGGGKAFVRNGGIVVQDADGKDVAFIGVMSDGARRGIELLDEHGNSLISLGQLSDGSNGLQIESAANSFDLTKMTTAGWAAPHLMMVSYNLTDFINVTSATFVDTWGVFCGSVLGPGVEVGIPWATGASTTGELQVTSNLPSNTQSVALPAGSSGYYFVRWAHGFPVGFGPMDLRVQARRTAGANNVTVYPSQAWVQDPSICFDGGNWVT